MYVLEALIGRKEVLESAACRFQNTHVVPLAQGMALIPLTDQLHCEIGNWDVASGFEKLNPALSVWAQHISLGAPVAYVEAVYFGGAGEQGAIVWSGGSQILELIRAEPAINQALQRLGIQVGSAHDEFDAIGLGRHRRTEDWQSTYPGFSGLGIG